MATSKTLTPTNVTIQIPAFTDKPDQRANSNCIDKEADAINALSDQLTKTESVTATIYDNDINKGDTVNCAVYAVGALKCVQFSISKTLSISTALNLRGFSGTILGGFAYNADDRGANINIQPNNPGIIFFRPNITANNANVAISGFALMT